MTEEEWLASESPVAMLAYLKPYSSDRKVLLYALALSYVRPELVTNHIQAWVEVVEAILAEKVAKESLEAVQVEAEYEMAYKLDGPYPLEERAYYSVLLDAVMCSWHFRESEYEYASEHEADIITELKSTWGAAANIVRDIYGSPFRPISFSPSWRTDTAVILAQEMYASRNFSAMPILADALQDAGCDNDDILCHCRTEHTHVRGCWVVDLVLNKS